MIRDNQKTVYTQLKGNQILHPLISSTTKRALKYFQGICYTPVFSSASTETRFTALVTCPSTMKFEADEKLTTQRRSF